MIDIIAVIILTITGFITFVTWVAWFYTLIFYGDKFIKFVMKKEIYDNPISHSFFVIAGCLIGLLTFYRYLYKDTIGLTGFFLDILYMPPELVDKLILLIDQWAKNL